MSCCQDRSSRVVIIGRASGGGLEGVIEDVRATGRCVEIEVLLADGSPRLARLQPDDWDWLELRKGDIVDLRPHSLGEPSATEPSATA